MPHACQDVGGGILEADDGNGANIPGSVEDAGTMSRVQSRGLGGVADYAMSELACHGPGGAGETPPTREALTYGVSFPKTLLWLRCLVAGCLYGSSNRSNLRVHFAHPHVWDTIVILEEGN